MAGTEQKQAQQATASVPQAAAAAAQSQPPAATAAAPAAAEEGSAEPQVEAQQPAATQTQAAAAADGSAPAGDAAAVPPTTSGQEASAVAAPPKLSTFGAGSSMFSGGGFGAIGTLQTVYDTTVWLAHLTPAQHTKAEGICCRPLHSCLAWASAID